MDLASYSHIPSWKDFFKEKSIVDFVERQVQEIWIPSKDHKIHLDIYHHHFKAPTVVYCHGMSSNGRMMAYFAKELFDKGYNVICPDLVGFGLTTKNHGSGTIPELIQNIIDTIRYVRKNYEGPCYLTGISLGGALSYYAAAAGAHVEAIACLCLMDLQAKETLEMNQRTSMLHTGKWLLNSFGKLIPKAQIPVRFFLNPYHLTDDKFVQNLFLKHPLVVKQYSMNSILSLINAKPAMPLKEFDRIPILVLHGTEDKLIPESVSKKNFESLNCKKKYVSLKNCGHIPLDSEVVAYYISHLHRWFKKHNQSLSLSLRKL